MSGEKTASQTASKAPTSVVLPSTFSNSPHPGPSSLLTLHAASPFQFWTTDYRTGFETLYNQLDHAVVQSHEILSTVNARVQAESAFSRALAPPALREDGFAANEGGSLRTGLESILSSTVMEARARWNLAQDLDRNIATPFATWSRSHEGRIASSRNLIESHLSEWEKAHANAAKLKTSYDEACRNADEAEDELAHHHLKIPTSPPRSTPTTSRSNSIETNKGKGRASEPGDDDAESVEGADTIDDDDVPLGRATISALARRFTVRKPAQPSGTTTGTETTESASTVEPKVGAALDWSKATISSLIDRVAGPQTGAGRIERARLHAEEVEKRYREAIVHLDTKRLQLEEVYSEHLAYVQRCETDRLKAAASVLKSFHVAVAALPKLIDGSLERVSTTVELLRPEKDVVGIIERSKTGSFQPRPITFHCHYSEPPSEAFGIDLRRYEETRGASDAVVPPVLTFLLDYIKNASKTISSNAEKRRIWLYETPLGMQHRLRSLLQDPSRAGHLRSLVDKFDLPVVASTVKLWLLELEIPPIVFSQYDELRHLYPKRVGSEIVNVPAKLLAEHLARMPVTHLEVVRAMILYFAEMIQSTPTDTEGTETDEVYLQKLALSVARCLVRPRQETSLSIDDRFPTLVFSDLVKNHAVIFASADELKHSKKREERYRPRRQRTKPVDARLSRSKIGVAERGTVGVEEGMELLQEHRKSLSSSEEAGEKGDVRTEKEKEKKTAEKGAEKEKENSEAEAEDKFVDTEDGEATPTTTKAKLLPLVEKQTEAFEEDASIVRGSPSLSRSTRTKGGRGPRPLSVGAKGGAVTTKAEEEASKETKAE
ncbi:BZ3500_MvSof-1268-A1-R1_Chr1-2g01385 [Microbotryum saponariae]|uniref:BZ3500_MvSof-1268-A1-R1_Chr1-2g01385 protein n=1 Tax=Microbotryum saponariae TaxID=289078 RepID=A0A2X0KTN7_9BASI|nr:BZ3500_MvSof-1268-A1-R1_Chr1-2g01385 [Microbotryum saponariae]SCZ97272.1 BZ3501_MvSof-1269-A2-R1_Chr1-2g00984 [Microbotryum saponariae]